MIILDLVVITALVILIILYLFVKSGEKSRHITNSKTISKVDILEQIKKLRELLDIGAISEEEYQEKKQKLLDKI